MSNFDLVSAVRPQGGWVAVVGIKDGSTRQHLVTTREEFDTRVERFVSQQYNVFFGLAKYRDGESRSKQNVESLQCFWLDIDCGEGKDYPDQRTGLLALKAFCASTGLPKPTVINSGRGLHVYWTLDCDITREEWEPVAARLKEVCRTQGLYPDPSCFEAARILRVPGTFNFKGDTPLPVTVVTVGDITTLDNIREVLGVRATMQPLVAATHRKSALGQLLQSSMESSFTKIIGMAEHGCAQLNSCYEERAHLSEPRWFDALSVAKFCSDRDEAIHSISADHPDYDPGLVQQKLRHIVGPHTCVAFAGNNPDGCNGCPHKGKIKSPIVLGREVIAATQEDNIVEDVTAAGEAQVYHIPEYPFPYIRGKNGGIWRKGIEGEEGEKSKDVLVYAHDLYMVKRMDDPNEEGVVLFRLHSPKDGVREFTMSNSKVTDGAELRKALAAKHIILPKKQYDMLVDYIIRSFEHLFTTAEVEQMRNQFGWADGDSKFIIGDREISADGVYHSPPSSVTRNFTELLEPVGTLEGWKEVFDLYGRPGLEAHAFGAATAFGAPLLKFSGHRGAIINLIHPSSGTGKTTVLHMVNSVWGNPVQLCAKKDDTLNAKVFKLGVMCNLPICFDEMTNTEPEELSELTYLISQGNGKDRMKASSNAMRHNNTSWQTIAICSSNNSFYEKLEIKRDSPQGEMMRVLEYYLDYSDAIDMELGKLMFDHQLQANYGHAGEIYARYVLNNHEEVKGLFMTIQQKIDRKLKLTQRERFWSATVAANITGIYIAVRLGLVNWNVGRIFKWACGMLESLRVATTPQVDATKQLLGEFLMNRIDNILVVNGGIDRRNNLEALPILEPRRELLVRYEPDKARVFVATSAFRRFCIIRGVSYRDSVRKMESIGLILGSGAKRMSKGMKVSLPSVHALELDATHPEFAALGDIIPVEVAATGTQAPEAVVEEQGEA